MQHVVRVPIPPVRYDVLTQVKDELSYVTVYNDCGDVFLLDMYGGMDMSMNCTVWVNLGRKKSRQTFEKYPFVDNGTVLCNVLSCINSGDLQNWKDIYLLPEWEEGGDYYDSSTIKS